MALIQYNLNDYKRYNYLGTIIAVTYLLSGIQRFVYNSHARKKIDVDIWLYADIIAGIFNLAAFNIIGNATPQEIMDVTYKTHLNYYMNVVIVMSWARYFSYFMILNTISKLTIILFKMLYELIPLLVIYLAYQLMMAFVFMTMFRDDPAADAQFNFTNILYTLRLEFDYTVGNYDTSIDMGKAYATSYEISYMFEVIVTFVFFTQVIVAIISSVYDSMIDQGDFYAITF